jgi:hypothetical protein
MKRQNVFLRWLIPVALCLLAYAADRTQDNSPRKSAIVLDSAEVSALNSAESGSVADFLERAKAMGVAGLAVRRQTIGGLAQRGQALIFSRQEVEKWKSLGLIAPATALRTNALWVKDARLSAHLLEALSVQGLVLSTAAASGHTIIELAREPDLGIMGALDGDDLATAAAHGLTAVEIDLAGRQARVVSGSGPAAALVPLRAFEPSVRLPALLRAIHGQPGRLLWLRLDAGASPEENLSRLRAQLRPLRELGLIGADMPWSDSGRPPLAPWRRFFAWLLAVLAPIIAIRSAVESFKSARSVILERRPLASPVAELLVGAAAAVITAMVLGSFVGWLLAGGPPLAALSDSPALSTMAWPLAIGLIALFPLSPRWLERRLHGSVRYLDLMKLGALCVAAVLIFQPRLFLSGTSVWTWFERAQDASSLFWWWPWRWREALVGIPALLRGLYLVGRGNEAGAADPKPWLWLGLLLPIGVVDALGRPELSIMFSAGCTIVVFLVGLALSAAASALFAAWLAWDQRPRMARSIDLDNKL